MERDGPATRPSLSSIDMARVGRRIVSKSRMRMRAIRIHRFGGPEVLDLEDVPVPQPRENELLVRIHAASVNPVDYKIRRGTVPWVTREMLPITLGRDLSGPIERGGAA